MQIFLNSQLLLKNLYQNFIIDMFFKYLGIKNFSANFSDSNIITHFRQNFINKIFSFNFCLKNFYRNFCNKFFY